LPTRHWESHRIIQQALPLRAAGPVSFCSLAQGEILAILCRRNHLLNKPALTPRHLITMDTPKIDITCYLKTFCGWSEGIRAIMRKHDLEFEEKDIIKNQAFRWEMEQKSGQPLSPCVIVNGEMLADVSGDEVEAYLLEKELVGASKAETDADAPTGSACTDEQHATMAQEMVQEGAIRFIDK
jgi:glutaredoxin